MSPLSAEFYNWCAMKRLPYQLPRYEVATFPGDSEVARMEHASL